MMDDPPVFPVPTWVPEEARRYLAHTVAGRPIRDLARRAGCHASTILRQIRRIELRRDDPLVDAALGALARDRGGPRLATAATRHPSPDTCSKERQDVTQTNQPPAPPDAATLDREAGRVLRRLCETGAVLAVAEGMDKAVVVRDAGPEGAGSRTAAVDSAIAQAMALKDWIACPAPGRISRYRITAAGRCALSRIVAADENRARTDTEHGFAEAQTGFDGNDGRAGGTASGERHAGSARRSRYSAAESPLTALARRRDRDGNRFLDDTLVQSGERLREDFELAQMGPRLTQNWDQFLTGSTDGGNARTGDVGTGPSGARDRVARALAELGPGLSDVALRCCCYLEGLETVEKRMGRSARSGKIVLRIALQRLRQHYDAARRADRMIG